MVMAVVVLSLARVEVDLSEGRDKWSHFLAYGMQMFWFCMLYAGQRTLAASFVAMGVALEVAQAFTGFRHFDVADMVANTGGVVLGWLAARTSLHRLLHWLDGLLSRMCR